MNMGKLKICGLALMVAALPLLVGALGGADSSPAPGVDDASAPVQPNPSPAITDDSATSVTTPLPAITQPPSPPVKLSGGAQEMVKLAQAGVSEDVMLAYIDLFKGKFSLGSDQIIYLNDL